MISSCLRLVAGRPLRPYQSYRGSYLRTLRCDFHTDGKNRVSNFWIPTGGISKKNSKGQKEDVNDLLVRGGFIRQAYSGIFHMLPLGLRVQEKLERLIDRHMRSLGASKVSLSSISSQELWEQSGRLKEGSEVFRFQDRKESRFLLAPTHEEEITTLVGSLTQSYRDLPLRVYQISRKYRDEPRPRQGLLRGREFIMKDLYTFDHSVEDALKTYESVRGAYTKLFDELKIPYLVAVADSGNMGGSLSHEYHFPSSKGEDTVVSCSNCDSVYNEELADGKAYGPFAREINLTPGFDTEGVSVQKSATVSTGLWTAVTKDKKTLIRGWYPKFTLHDGSVDPVEREVNSHAVKSIASAAGIDLDISVENPTEQWIAEVKAYKAALGENTRRPQVLDLYDTLVRGFTRPPLSDLLHKAGCAVDDIEYQRLDCFPGTGHGLNLIKVQDGDQCPKCTQGALKVHKAVELGHTFHLGTRYSEVLGASVMVDKSDGTQGSSMVPMEMGCHGIGVSRMIATVADSLADAKGLSWPRAIAPFEAVIIPARGLDDAAERIYEELANDVDVILDDRDKQMGWKFADADLIGYPVILVVGKGWKTQRTVELQCRRLNVREDVPLERLHDSVVSALSKL